MKNIELQKAGLRKKVSEEIAQLQSDYVVQSDKAFLHKIEFLKEFIEARNIMIYCSVEREPCTAEIMAAAYAMGKTVAFPYCYKGGIMDARIVPDPRELRPAMLGIPAPPDTAPVILPEALDFILVPALAYDTEGFRLGYGGGYYDRYLATTRAFTAGLTRERLIKNELPRQQHDVAVDCIVTEKDVRFCPATPKK